jgi:ribulose 1,5-bisphosphate synthetase/thiazole synthase
MYTFITHHLSLAPQKARVVKQTQETAKKMKKTKIVIAGGGFAGLTAATYLDKRLARRPDIEVVLICRENFILFTPMLHGHCIAGGS